MKTKKLLLIPIIMLLFLAGVLYGLQHLKVIDISGLYKKIPVVGEKNGDSEKNPLQKIEQENDKLKQDIEEQQELISQYEEELKKMKQLQTAYESLEKERNELIIQLNEQQKETLSQEPLKDYKKMAKYYAEMKSQDAADLLAELLPKDAAGILQAMQTDISAQIIAKLPRGKAVEITKIMMDSRSN